MANNWDEIPGELLMEIAKQVTWVEDYAAFSGVCTLWQSAAAAAFLYPIPLLMLAPRKDSHLLEFYHLSDQIVNQVSLSEALTGKRCYSSKGCLITIGHDLNVNLIHPFSNLQHKFPNIKTINRWDKFVGSYSYDTFIIKCALSSNPLLESDYILMVIFGAGHELVYARPGDETWTFLSDDFYYDVTYYRGQFYAVNCDGQIMAFNIGGGDNPSETEQVFEFSTEILENNTPDELYIVESADALLIISPYIYIDEIIYDEESEEIRNYRSCEFHVFNVDLNTKTCTEIKDLGDRIIFLGHNSTFSMAHPPNCKPNSIYFTDDCKVFYCIIKEGGGKDMGIYSLQDGSITPHYSDKSFDPITPPMWIEQSYKVECNLTYF